MEVVSHYMVSSHQQLFYKGHVHIRVFSIIFSQSVSWNINANFKTYLQSKTETHCRMPPTYVEKNITVQMSARAIEALVAP